MVADDLIASRATGCDFSVACPDEVCMVGLGYSGYETSARFVSAINIEDLKDSKLGVVLARHSRGTFGHTAHELKAKSRGAIDVRNANLPKFFLEFPTYALCRSFSVLSALKPAHDLAEVLARQKTPEIVDHISSYDLRSELKLI
jgi:hypothetical protein